MKLYFGKLSKIVLVLTAGMALTSCGSIGGFSELLGISNEGIDAQSVEVNDPLKNAKNGDLPTPEGAALNTVPVTNAVASSTPKIVAPKIVAPKIVAPKIAKPKVAVVKVAKPKVSVPKVTVPKVTKTTIVPKVDATPIVAPVKISPLAYKFVDLFTFRSDMRAGKLLNPLATAKRIADNNPKTCKLAGNKFTCGEYFITVK